MGHLLMTGALWEDQIATDADLPSKGEEMIAVFYVREVLMCTNITLIPRRQPDIYLYSSESMDEMEFEQIIKDIKESVCLARLEII
jgi:hypothetical protein